MKKIIYFVFSITFIFACGSSTRDSSSSSNKVEKAAEETKDDGKGIGEITHVTLNNPLDIEMIKRGQSIAELKCTACHTFTDQRVVGPGWAGVTKKRKPEWIMNMVTNVDVMLKEADRYVRSFVAVEDEAQRERAIENIEVTTYNAASGDTEGKAAWARASMPGDSPSRNARADAGAVRLRRRRLRPARYHVRPSGSR